MEGIAFINTPRGWQPNRDAGNWRQPRISVKAGQGRQLDQASVVRLGNSVHRLAHARAVPSPKK